MTAEDYGLTAIQFQFYDLGRQARAAGYSREACNISGVNEKLGAWLSGWWDQDAEMRAMKHE